MTDIMTIKSATAIEIPDYKLFSGTQILIGTIFGMLITGQVMLALNYAKIKDYEDANRKMLFGTVYFPLLLMIPGINLVAGFYILINTYIEFKEGQSKAVEKHLMKSGKFCSYWDVAALCVLSFIAVYTIFFLVMIAFYFLTQAMDWIF